MKICHWVTSALMFATAGTVSAQTPPQCPAAAQAEGNVATGNRTVLDPAMNAETDVPADSPLAGLPNGYRTEFDWAKMPAGRVWGDARAIAIDKDGKSVWLLDRCGLTEDGCAKPANKGVNPLVKFDSNGNVVKAFGAGMFSAPHGIFVDKAGNIWTADGAARGCQAADAPVGNLLRKWSPNGKLLMTISGPQGGKPFTGLNDVVVSPVNGDIFVADGHSRPANDRIMKFDKNGKYLMEWGTPGKADNEIGIPHALAMDKQGRIYVADRSNGAVKVYNQSGKLLNVWRQFGEPSGVYIDKHDRLYVVDETANMPVRNPKLSPGVRIATLDGKIVANIPYRKGNSLEGIAVDDAGNIYGANTNHPRAVRFMKE